MIHENGRDQRIKRKWLYALRAMLVDFRERFPKDTRTDTEFLTSLMDHFYKTGAIEKAPDGKYILPDIEGAIEIEPSYLQ